MTDREGVARLTRVAKVAPPTESTGLMPPIAGPAVRAPAARPRAPGAARPRWLRRPRRRWGRRPASPGSRPVRGGRGRRPRAAQRHGPLRHRGDGGHHHPPRHDPRHDRQRVPLGVAAPAAGPGVAGALPDERDAAAHRPLRGQRAGIRPGEVRRPLRGPAGLRRGSRRSCGRTTCRCWTGRWPTWAAGSSTSTPPGTTCCGSARSSTSITARASRCCSTRGGSGRCARPQDREAARAARRRRRGGER